jgi:plasmid stabilization system protein ParE
MTFLREYESPTGYGTPKGRRHAAAPAACLLPRSAGATADSNLHREAQMPQGDKSAYTKKQQRKADHIAEGYEERGVAEKEAERRAWATVNKQEGGGKKSGSARKPSSESKSKRSAAAKKGWETRRKKGKG